MDNEREPQDVTQFTRPPDKRAMGYPLGCAAVLLILALIGAVIYGMN